MTAAIIATIEMTTRAAIKNFTIMGEFSLDPLADLRFEPPDNENGPAPTPARTPPRPTDAPPRASRPPPPTPNRISEVYWLRLLAN